MPNLILTLATHSLLILSMAIVAGHSPSKAAARLPWNELVQHHQAVPPPLVAISAFGDFHKTRNNCCHYLFADSYSSNSRTSGTDLQLAFTVALRKEHAAARISFLLEQRFCFDRFSFVNHWIGLKFCEHAPNTWMFDLDGGDRVLIYVQGDMSPET